MREDIIEMTFVITVTIFIHLVTASMKENVITKEMIDEEGPDLVVDQIDPTLNISKPVFYNLSSPACLFRASSISSKSQKWSGI